MKKTGILFLSLSLFSAFILTGCGESNEPAADVPITDGSDGGPQPTALEPAGGGGGTQSGAPQAATTE